MLGKKRNASTLSLRNNQNNNNNEPRKISRKMNVKDKDNEINNEPNEEDENESKRKVSDSSTNSNIEIPKKKRIIPSELINNESGNSSAVTRIKTNNSNQPRRQLVRRKVSQQQPRWR